MKKIALFVHHPICSFDCCEGMIEALSPSHSLTLFTIDQVTPGCFAGYDAVAFPGGIGDVEQYYQIFKRKAANVVADYVEQGGCYLGICMGAYWADRQYFDIIDDIQAVQYIKQPTADVRRSYGTTAAVSWNGQHDMYFYDGATFIGDQTTFDIIARYKNNDPMAIIKGRVGLIGCHPESQQSWYDKPYLTPKWHGLKHHRLLVEFVDQLLSK